MVIIELILDEEVDPDVQLLLFRLDSHSAPKVAFNHKTIIITD